MSIPMNVGYLVVGASRPERWSQFCATMLGLPPALANSDGSCGFRIDDAAQRLIVAHDPADDLIAFGVDCGTARGLDEAVARLRQTGGEVVECDAQEREARRVLGLFRTLDPAGNAVELYWGLERHTHSFESQAFPGGFHTGPLGFGHLALVHRDLQAMEGFYARLGFAVTERLDTKVGPIRIRGTFLHCNARHHSLALFDMPSRKRIHHFMLQARDHMDVGRAFERTRSAKVPLSLEIGQHPDPDGTFSFYATTPSGFDFEIGAGGKEIDPAGWQPLHASTPSSWGHRARLRLKLRTVGDLVATRLFS